MSVGIAILGLALLVFVHEAGHFLTARAVGMRPRRFYVGFPPALVKAKRKGIEYGIGAIPLGGYVKIPGMHRPAPSDLDVHFGAAQVEAPLLVGPVERVKRLVEHGEFAAAREELPELVGAVKRARLSPRTRRAGERGVEEIGDALAPDAYWRQRTWKRLAVIFAGPATNLVFAIVLLAVVYMIGIPFDASRRVERVSTKLEGKPSPAARAGLRPGDVVIGVDYQAKLNFKQVSEAIRDSKGKPIVLNILRNGVAHVIGPLRATKTSSGYYAVGFEPAGIRYRSYGPLHAFNLALGDTWTVTKGIGSAVGRIVTGSGRKEVSTPVGIVSESSKAVKTDYRDYLQVLAVISLSLALLNLLPFLPLDGGHMAFSVIEGIRGRAVGRSVYERASAVGIAIVLLLFFVGLSNDIGRLSGG
jgi:regulator of sigma E protease